LAGLFQAKYGGEHVPKDKIHADKHVDDVKEDTIAQIFQLIDAAFKVPNNFVDWFHHFVEELLDRVGLLLLLFGFGVVLFYGRCRFVFRC
jgi:ribosomal protein L16 Arg81 hydroxylase